jgi:hypothetical protein
VLCALRYSVRQLLSAGLAVSGIVTLLLLDDQSDGLSGPKKWRIFWGDILVITGATGYAVNNVLSEHLLTTADTNEVLAGLGCFGTLMSLINVPAFERSALAAVHWTAPVAGLLIIYCLALFFFSLGVPVLLKKNGSTVRKSSPVPRSDLRSACSSTMDTGVIYSGCLPLPNHDPANTITASPFSTREDEGRLLLGKEEWIRK